MKKRQNTSQARGRKRITASSQPTKASIMSLPPELLSIIFKFVHHESPQTNEPRELIPRWMKKMDEGLKRAAKALVHREEQIDFSSPTLFPYSMAAVSPYWSEILSSHPEFWTLVVFFVDSRYTSMAQATIILKRSRKLPIHVVITRREGFRMKEYPDLHEKCQIEALINLLRPHLPRCKSLHIDAHLSLSLPVVPKAFAGVGEVEDMFSMELVSDVYDEGEHEEEDSDDDSLSSISSVDIDEFEPDLRSLIVDGQNFRRGAEEYESWLSDQDKLKQLTVMRYHAPLSSSEDEPYTVSCFIDHLWSLCSVPCLKLHDIRFQEDALKAPHLPTFLPVEYLHLEDVNSGFVNTLFKYVEFDDLVVLRITRSSVPKRCNLPALSLILEEITSECDFMDTLTVWRGDNLCIDSCAGFTDEFLKRLAVKEGPFLEIRETKALMTCYNLQRLLLYRLSNVSVAALKNLVKQRNKYVGYNNPNWRTTTDFGPALSSLAVVHCKVEKLSAADEKWFRSRLVEFYWVN
ncbi:hypothetical protein GALMADRAFT_873705 [Galerina marginata CBS 339.88]|uniref:F-box domain-containing protein n=1 Tax=Galerina marginata (strain CBS 339.88) TaxID=685588 RepID=A0A067TTD0_GALM3|nr:hypothetical protein GALMADRAFT_873705 [Galerina marginata CBS 339.88]